MDAHVDLKQNKTIATVAQFLLINAEAISNKGLDGKMPLIYFFFTYSKTYSKEHYGHFAFEILEDVIMEELSVIENHKGEENSKIAGIGWSLMCFIENQYFESDDLEDILKLIDKAILLDIDTLLKSTVNSKNLNALIVHCYYLLERLKLAQNNDSLFSKLNDALQRILFKIGKNLDVFSNNYISIALYNELFENSSKELKKHVIPLQIKEIKTLIFSLLINKGAYEKGIVFNALYFGNSEDFKVNRTLLLKKIGSSMPSLMKSLLNKTADHNLVLSKLVIQAIFLCKEDKLNDEKLFFLGMLNNLKTIKS